MENDALNAARQDFAAPNSERASDSDSLSQYRLAPRDQPAPSQADRVSSAGGDTRETQVVSQGAKPGESRDNRTEKPAASDDKDTPAAGDPIGNYYNRYKPLGTGNHRNAVDKLPGSSDKPEPKPQPDQPQPNPDNPQPGPRPGPRPQPQPNPDVPQPGPRPGPRPWPPQPQPGPRPYPQPGPRPYPQPGPDPNPAPRPQPRPCPGPSP